MTKENKMQQKRPEQTEEETNTQQKAESSQIGNISENTNSSKIRRFGDA